MTQQCGRCKENKPQEDFSPSYRGKSGTWCKPCFAAYSRGERGPSKPHDPRECVRCGAVFIPKRRSMFCSRECRVGSGRARESYLARTYGITHDDYARMLAEQGGGCAICGKRPEEQKRYSKYLHVDHDHETGRVRGLLCDQHNLLLGRWSEDPVLLRKAAEYLERP